MRKTFKMINEAKPRQKKGISGSTLKMIAIISMLIDHTGAILLAPRLQVQGSEVVMNHSAILYILLRQIGRLAFPIFCFLLVEGFFHTRSKIKYAGRLFLFAILSEIPFDLAFKNKWLEFTYQNVFFTLFIGLLMMMGLQAFRERILPKINNNRKLLALMAQLILFMAASAAAALLRTDYSFWGVIAIFAMYILHYNKRYMCLCEALYFITFEGPAAAISMIPVWFYNGKRGWNLKYLFYIFYPAHLLILYGINFLI